MVGETWNGFTTRLRNEPWSHAAEETKQEKQKAFLGSEKQNPPAEGALLVCLDFADVVIDGMTSCECGAEAASAFAKAPADQGTQSHA